MYKNKSTCARGVKMFVGEHLVLNYWMLCAIRNIPKPKHMNPSPGSLEVFLSPRIKAISHRGELTEFRAGGD